MYILISDDYSVRKLGTIKAVMAHIVNSKYVLEDSEPPTLSKVKEQLASGGVRLFRDESDWVEKIVKI